MKRRVFISYKRVDQIVVFDVLKKIEDTIKEKCWIDQKGIPSDARWDEEIRSAIDDCEVFVFICSKEHNNIREVIYNGKFNRKSFLFKRFM